MNTLGFMALDARSVRPYTLPLIGAAVLGVAVGQLGSAGYPTATLSIAAVIVTMLVSSYLFSLDERSGLDTLYGLVRLTRAQVVIGRYATLLTAALVSTLLGVLA
ncbi:MAG: ABC-2 transporter permease, partial [Propioniciclava sp.]